MPVRATYISLPVNDIQATRKFWTALGFSFEENYSNDKILALTLNETTAVMLLRRDHFARYTHKSITDGKQLQTILTMEIENKEKVDALLEKALAEGGKAYQTDESLVYDGTYTRSFFDIDGHQWELLSPS